jgi:hypothetical protein
MKCVSKEILSKQSKIGKRPSVKEFNKKNARHSKQRRLSNNVARKKPSLLDDKYIKIRYFILTIDTLQI